MTTSPDTVKECIRQLLTDAGACRVGFAEASPVDEHVDRAYRVWIAGGKHAGMAYLDRYYDVRRDPRLLLEGARTVICCAFDYRPATRHPLFADYALGADYHDVIRLRLAPVAEQIVARFGGQTRICVDTAPIRERYWAARAGIGFVGLNGLLIVDGIGSKVFLAEIIWTGSVTPDQSNLGRTCEGCRRCIDACPGHALTGDRTLDARRCHSYLTIEHRGPLPEGLTFRGRIYGCDICQDVCPHNQTSGTTNVEEFAPAPALLKLDRQAVAALTEQSFSQIFSRSAVRRAKLAGLLRNIERAR